jgi:hypothetical protein
VRREDERLRRNGKQRLLLQIARVLQPHPPSAPSSNSASSTISRCCLFTVDFAPDTAADDEVLELESESRSESVLGLDANQDIIEEDPFFLCFSNDEDDDDEDLDEDDDSDSDGEDDDDDVVMLAGAIKCCYIAPRSS